jgi:hypothetical protein
VERADAIARELADIVKSFDDWVAKEMPALNSALEKGSLGRIEVLSREKWE